MLSEGHAKPPAPARESAVPMAALFDEQVSVVREMFSALETCSVAGQRYVMSKVVAFMEGQTSRLFPGQGTRNRLALTDLVTSLRRESDRMVPDVSAFVGRAESLLCLLTTVAYRADRLAPKRLCS